MRSPALLLALALPAAAAEPQLARVTLSSGGVGQFEFTASVDGGATVPLDVPLDLPVLGTPSVLLLAWEPLCSLDDGVLSLPAESAAVVGPSTVG